VDEGICGQYPDALKEISQPFNKNPHTSSTYFRQGKRIVAIWRSHYSVGNLEDR
jgi:hypothetical protein